MVLANFYSLVSAIAKVPDPLSERSVTWVTWVELDTRDNLADWRPSRDCLADASISGSCLNKVVSKSVNNKHCLLVFRRIAAGPIGSSD